jgi:hypothetical protein
MNVLSPVSVLSKVNLHLTERERKELNRDLGERNIFDYCRDENRTSRPLHVKVCTLFDNVLSSHKSSPRTSPRASRRTSRRTSRRASSPRASPRASRRTPVKPVEIQELREQMAEIHSSIPSEERISAIVKTMMEELKTGLISNVRVNNKAELDAAFKNTEMALKDTFSEMQSDVNARVMEMSKRIDELNQYVDWLTPEIVELTRPNGLLDVVRNGPKDIANASKTLRARYAQRLNPTTNATPVTNATNVTNTTPVTPVTPVTNATNATPNNTKPSNSRK